MLSPNKTLLFFTLSLLAVIFLSVIPRAYAVDHASDQTKIDLIIDSHGREKFEQKRKFLQEEVLSLAHYITEQIDNIPNLIEENPKLHPIEIPSKLAIEAVISKIISDFYQRLHGVNLIISFDTSSQLNCSARFFSEFLLNLLPPAKRKKDAINTLTIYDFTPNNKPFALLGFFYFYSRIKTYYFSMHFGDILRSLLGQLEKIDHDLSESQLAALRKKAAGALDQVNEEDVLEFYTENFLERIKTFIEEKYQNHFEHSLKKILDGQAFVTATRFNNFNFLLSTFEDFKPGKLSERTLQQLKTVDIPPEISIKKVNQVRKIIRITSQNEAQKKNLEWQVKLARAKELFEFVSYLQEYKKIKLEDMPIEGALYNKYKAEFEIHRIEEAVKFIGHSTSSSTQSRPEPKEAKRGAKVAGKKTKAKAKETSNAKKHKESLPAADSLSSIGEESSVAETETADIQTTSAKVLLVNKLNENHSRIKYHPRVTRWQKATTDDLPSWSDWPSYAAISDDEELQRQIFAHSPASLARFLRLDLREMTPYCWVSKQIHEKWGPITTLKFPASMHYQDNDELGIISIVASKQANGKYLVYHAMFKNAANDRQLLAAIGERHQIDEGSSSLEAQRDEELWEHTGLFYLNGSGDIEFDVKSQEVKFRLIKFRK